MRKITKLLQRNTQFLIITGIILIQGCAVNFGKDFDPKAFHKWVVTGQTSKSDVIKFLGPPTSKGMVIERDGTILTRFLYYYGKGKLSDMENAKFKMLEVRFTDDKKVSNYNWSAASE